jgi:hypothetical protein
MNFGPTPTSSLFVLGFKKRCFQREKLLHEQVPNTNIKFFCLFFQMEYLKFTGPQIEIPDRQSPYCGYRLPRRSEVDANREILCGGAC